MAEPGLGKGSRGVEKPAVDEEAGTTGGPGDRRRQAGDGLLFRVEIEADLSHRAVRQDSDIHGDLPRPEAQDRS
jgi:hypothetical protein